MMVGSLPVLWYNKQNSIDFVPKMFYLEEAALPCHPFVESNLVFMIRKMKKCLFQLVSKLFNRNQ